MPSLYLPKTYDPKPDKPVIFLAGPIAWGGHWQVDAARYIHLKAPNIIVAAPLREVPADLLKLQLPGKITTERQLPWEQALLEIAGSQGAVLFWLPTMKEFPVLLGRESRAYARDTRVELGKWMTEAKYRKNVRVVIGGEDKFDGIDVVKRNVKKELRWSDLQFPKTLEETCEAAIAAVRKRRWCERLLPGWLS